MNWSVVCPVCGLSSAAWTDGGYAVGNRMFCCRGCAEIGECICDALAGPAPDCASWRPEAGSEAVLEEEEQIFLEEESRPKNRLHGIVGE